MAAGPASAVDVFEDFTVDPLWAEVGNLPGDGLGLDFGYSGGTNNASDRFPITMLTSARCSVSSR